MKRFLFACALLLVGCETVIEVDLPDHDPLLVVESYFRQDAPWAVTVHHTVPTQQVLDDASREILERATVTNAQVEIWAGGARLLTLPHQGNGRYVAAAGMPTPKVGHTYTVRVSAAGYPSVTGSDAIPEAVSIAEAFFTDSLMSAGRTEATFDVAFVDPPAAENYYGVQILERYGDEPWFHPSFRSRDTELQDNPFEDLDEGETHFFGPTYFDDATFDGATVDLNLRFDRQEAEYRVDLLITSEVFHRYLRTRELAQETDGNPFAEPVSAFTNLTGGLGVFAGYHQQEAGRLLPPPVTPEKLAGTYAASYLSIYDPATRYYFPLREGGRFDLTINVDGTASGKLVVPQIPDLGNTALDLDLVGTYQIGVPARNSVVFTLSPPSFLNEMKWLLLNDVLVGKVENHGPDGWTYEVVFDLNDPQ